MNLDLLERAIVAVHAVGEIKIGTSDGGDFTLNSGRKSPLYVDMRGLGVYPDVCNLVADCYAEMLREVAFDRLIGIPEAGTPLAAVVGSRGGFPTLWARTEEKDHGGGAGMIVGQYEIEDIFCLLDNVITTGKAVLKWLDRAITEQRVKHCAVFVDREEGGASVLRGRGIETHSRTTMEGVVETLHRRSSIDAALYRRGREYLESPSAYQERYYPAG